MVSTSDLIGTWSLLSYEVGAADGGPMRYPMGQDASGRLTYGADGTVSAFLVSPALVTDQSAGDRALRLAALDTFLAYYGTFELNGSTVTHHITMASGPQIIGLDQVREIESIGEQLVLSAHQMFGGVYSAGRLVW